MRLLVDSNALIWALTDPRRLSLRAMQVLRSRENRIVISLASLWEITIKISRGKLPQLGDSLQPLLDEIKAQDFELLPILSHHLLSLGNLEHHHRDPFDRLIIAQSAAENLPVVTSDGLFLRYRVEVIW